MEGKLNNFQVGHLPTVIYKPDFITESEEMLLLDKVVIPLLLFLFLCFFLLRWTGSNSYLQVYGAPISKWKSLKNRRLQNWGILETLWKLHDRYACTHTPPRHFTLYQCYSTLSYWGFGHWQVALSMRRVFYHRTVSWETISCLNSPMMVVL